VLLLLVALAAAATLVVCAVWRRLPLGLPACADVALNHLLLQLLALRPM
jgi:hypothetical protein